MPSIGLFIHGSHRLFPDVLRLAERVGKPIVFDCDNQAGEGEIAFLRPDIVCNFITRNVFRGSALELPNVNFHPAPSSYPGIGGVSRALYEKAGSFGATAHRMVKKVDAGEIYFSESVPIFETDTPESLFARTEGACVTLFARFCDHLFRYGTVPPASGEQWSGRYMSIREFHEEWLRLDITDPTDMERKLRAATHSKHPGPYFVIHGRRFVLAK